ncbi:MAG TPA: type II secretion system inner membrane protein GspF [Pseudomonadota bacterium]|jgi:general secretion pathway protein F|nr:type II secretion system inner membrane protein GspF [Pseudomonadota bacterium]HND09170.1 type II secretion system inner membrane protein GspF [Pseudomonadota bacterium]HNF97149.1 type II secretion system inner membrane protein GspF [Pseudomonadota bacterium]HNK44320.1 type II secretion system inner membrane protein GspF [Pseudomonadota bacterium]HNN52883.1 type II secretion system inner membrane protein GspF [Pseudomonadota bacterium]
MPVFRWKGYDGKGKQVQGVRDSESPRTLRQALKREGIMLSDVSEAQVGVGKSKKKASDSQLDTVGQGLFVGLLVALRLGFVAQAFAEYRRTAKPMEIAVLTRQLGTLLRAGVQLSESLAALIEQAEDPNLKQVMSDVKVQVNEGLPLSSAMARHPGCFGELYVNMVTAGETAGNLEAVLLRLADFLESQNKLRAKVMSAMMYPIIMTVLAVGILTLLMTTVVPKVTAIFADTGRALPLNTQILIFISTLVSDYLWLLLIIGIGSFVAFRRWVSTPKGRLSWDTFKLRVPVLGGLERKVAVSRFAKTLSTMLASGVQLLRAMEIVKNVLGNTVLMNVIEQARESIREGESIAAPLKRSGQFPAIVCHMIAVGERSGQLEQMLENVSGAYDLEVETQLERLTALLSPLMILGMGGAVFFVVTSIMLPIMQMNDFVQ